MVETLEDLRAQLHDRPTSALVLQGVLERANEADPEVYRAQWMPALAAATLPRFFAETYDDLMILLSLLPDEAQIYARFEDEVEHEAMLELLDRHAPRIVELSLMHATSEEMQAILAHPGLASIPALRLGGVDDYWGGEVVSWLAEASHLGQLRSLSFTRASELEDEHLLTLANTSHLRGLRALRLESPAWEQVPMHRVGDEGVEALIEAFVELELLDLGGCVSITEAAVEGLTGLGRLRALGGVPIAWASSSMPRLTHLDLSDRALDVSILTAHQTELRYLQLARTQSGPDVAAALARSDAFPELRHLGFLDVIDWSDCDQFGIGGCNSIRLDDIEVFQGSERMPHLEYVDFLGPDDYPESLQRVEGGEWESDLGELVSGHEPCFPLPDR